MDLFFIDYDGIPAMVQDNYLNAMGERKGIQDIMNMAEASDYISLGESINHRLRTT